MKLIKVTDVQGCFSENPTVKVIDVNPKAVAWIEPIGTAFGAGPYFCVHFIGYTAVTVSIDDYGRIIEASAN